MVMLHRLACDQSPPCRGSIGGHIKGQLRVGRPTIPISFVKPLSAEPFARPISRTAVLPIGIGAIAAHLLARVRRLLGYIGRSEQLGRAAWRDRVCQYV